MPCVVDSLGLGITLYHSTHLDLVSFAFYAIPIFHICNLLVYVGIAMGGPAL